MGPASLAASFTCTIDAATGRIPDGCVGNGLDDTGAGTFSTTTQVLTGTDTTTAATPDAIAALWEKGTNVASAATVSLGEGGVFHVTGSTTITDIDFAVPKDGRRAIVIFDGALTLTHNATTLVIPGGASITTAAGDVAVVVQDNADNVKIAGYVRQSAAPPSGHQHRRPEHNLTGDVTGGPSTGSISTTITADAVASRPTRPGTMSRRSPTARRAALTAHARAKGAPWRRRSTSPRSTRRRSAMRVASRR